MSAPASVPFTLHEATSDCTVWSIRIDGCCYRLQTYLSERPWWSALLWRSGTPETLAAVAEMVADTRGPTHSQLTATVDPTRPDALVLDLGPVRPVTTAISIPISLWRVWASHVSTAHTGHSLRDLDYVDGRVIQFPRGDRHYRLYLPPVDSVARFYQHLLTTTEPVPVPGHPDLVIHRQMDPPRISQGRSRTLLDTFLAALATLLWEEDADLRRQRPQCRLATATLGAGGLRLQAGPDQLQLRMTPELHGLLSDPDPFPLGTYPLGDTGALLGRLDDGWYLIPADARSPDQHWYWRG